MFRRRVRAATFSRAVVSGDSLTEQERRNLRWMLSAVTARYETMYSQFKEGLIDRELWSQYRGSMAGFLRYPIVKAWWDAQSTPFPADFRGEIDTTPREQWVEYAERARAAHEPPVAQ